MSRKVRRFPSLKILAAVSGLALIVASGCKKGGDSVEPVAEAAGIAEVPAGNKKPVSGVSLDGLSESQKNRFERLVDKLPSPCGKAHSLRTSVNEDASCKRAKYAAEYVVTMLGDAASNKDVRDFYKARYQSEKPEKLPRFKLGDSPHEGPTDARIQLVEFYDYGCGACAQFKPVLEEVMSSLPAGDVVLYYKMFPLDSHVNSKGAAQAALAAFKQGKGPDERYKNFKAMHDVLFKNMSKQTKTDLTTHAKALNLDMKAFEKDYGVAKTQVMADKEEGLPYVQGTPTLLVNGLRYEGPRSAKYIKAYIAEVMAVGS